MELFLPEFFFCLEGFSHRAIFEGASYVWDPLGYLSGYLGSLSLGKIEVEVPSSAYLVHPELISIGKGTVVEPGAYVQGPCVIGPNCQVRHGAYIRGGVLTGSDCVIGHATEIKNSILLNRAHAAHFNYVGDSILGNDVNLGAGVKLANLRLDKKQISILVQGERVFTGLVKFGAIIGDRSQLGCNAVTNPGTILPPRTLCLPCHNLSGYVPSRKKVTT